MNSPYNTECLKLQHTLNCRQNSEHAFEDFTADESDVKYKIKVQILELSRFLTKNKLQLCIKLIFLIYV